MATSEPPHYLLIEATEQQLDAVRYIFSDVQWQQCVRFLTQDQVKLLSQWEGKSDTATWPAIDNGSSLGPSVYEKNGSNKNASTVNMTDHKTDFFYHKKEPSCVLNDTVSDDNLFKTRFCNTFSYLEKFLDDTKLSMVQTDCLNPELERLFNNYMQVTRLFCQTVGNMHAKRNEGEIRCEQIFSGNTSKHGNMPNTTNIETFELDKDESSNEVKGRLAKVLADRKLSKPEEPESTEAVKSEQAEGDKALKNESNLEIDMIDAGNETVSDMKEEMSDSSDESTDTASPPDLSGIQLKFTPRGPRQKWGIKGKTNFQCPYCMCFYVNSRTLRRHIFKKHPENAPRFPCDICHKQFVTRDELRQHGRDEGHTGTKPETFQCELCGKCLKRYDSYLKHHDRIHVNKYEYPCDVCGRMFNAIDTVKAHKRRVHTNDPTPCDVCGKMFPQRLAMLCHRRRHDERKRTHCCNQCGKAFFNLQPLKIHMRSHTGEKPYKCSMCSYACTCRANLTKHLKIHKKQELSQDNCTSNLNVTDSWPSQAFQFQNLS